MSWHAARAVGGLALLAASLCGCAALFPRSHVEIVSGWEDFVGAKGAFDRISPGLTTVSELQEIGYEPTTTPNLRLLNYLEVTRLFLPNPSIRMDDIDPAVRECIARAEDCLAYEIDLHVVDRQRYGNLLLDVLGFRQYARESGWSFRALIVINGEQVVHKQWSGQPSVERIEKKETPLGPLQEVDLGSAVRGIIR